MGDFASAAPLLGSVSLNESFNSASSFNVAVFALFGVFAGGAAGCARSTVSCFVLDSAAAFVDFEVRDFLDALICAESCCLQVTNPQLYIQFQVSNLFHAGVF